jgi:hypothetical protein
MFITHILASTRKRGRDGRDAQEGESKRSHTPTAHKQHGKKEKENANTHLMTSRQQAHDTQQREGKTREVKEGTGSTPRRKEKRM